MVSYLFSSESVTEGHPDKVCDQVSDAILDAYLKQDPNSRVAVETLTTKDFIMVAGEVTSKATINTEEIVRQTLKEIGYTDKAYGLNGETCEFKNLIHSQSPDISQGVTETDNREQGAGDQGIMFGYASDETKSLMPLPIHLAHRLTEKLAEVRKSGAIKGLGPDGKSQVSVEYVDDKPKRITSVVIAQQHIEEVVEADLRKEITEKVIKPVCGNLIDEDTKFLINGTGKFVVGGPLGDAGVTGRKIIVDTYGGMGRHGGGAFSGKDPSKVDRSATYMARHLAKNVVAKGLAKRCEVQLGYCIGVAEPTSVFVESFGTGNNEEIKKWILDTFDLKPKAIIEYLKLKNPIFRKTASYGHFGRDGFSWEKLIE